MQLTSFPGEVRRLMRISRALTILVVSFGFIPAGSAIAQSANGIDGYQNYEQLTAEEIDLSVLAEKIRNFSVKSGKINSWFFLF